MTARRLELCVDCADESVLLPWWSAALGWEVVDGPDDDGSRELAGREAPALQSRLVDELGGSVVRTTASTYVVLADPEGNELCLCWG